MLRKRLPAVAASLVTLLAGSAANATVQFDVLGLAGTGVTGHASFTYTSTSATTAAITIAIENTTTVDGRISGYAFNVPTIGGTSFTSIAGVTDGGSVVGIGSPNSSAIPENSLSNESGWYSKWASDGIKTPNAAGDFDFGVMNSSSSNSFITDGVGSGPRITNTSDSNDITTFTLNIAGTGLNNDSLIENAFMTELSTDAGFYSFGIRYQGIGTNGLSDLAVPGTPPPVPLPGAAVLAALGLGIAGFVNRRRA